MIIKDDTPLIYSEIRHNMRLRDKLRKRFLRQSAKVTMFHLKTKEQSEQHDKICKRNFIHKIDDILGNPEIGNSSKTFWQVMGRFMGKTGTSITVPPLHKQNKTLAFSDFEKAQELNSYFASISTIDDTNTVLPYLKKNVVM